MDPNEQFPLGIVADTERRVNQLVASSREVKCVESVDDIGFGYEHKPPMECLALPVECRDDLRQLFDDVKSMGAWIRKQHGE